MYQMARYILRQTMNRFKLLPEWRLMHRLWSVRIALFWGAFCGLYAALSVFANLLNPIVFAVLSAVMCAAIAGARILKQPGLGDGE